SECHGQGPRRGSRKGLAPRHVGPHFLPGNDRSGKRAFFGRAPRSVAHMEASTIERSSQFSEAARILRTFGICCLGSRMDGDGTRPTALDHLRDSENAGCGDQSSTSAISFLTGFGALLPPGNHSGVVAYSPRDSRSKPSGCRCCLVDSCDDDTISRCNYGGFACPLCPPGRGGLRRGILGFAQWWPFEGGTEEPDRERNTPYLGSQSCMAHPDPGAPLCWLSAGIWGDHDRSLYPHFADAVGNRSTRIFLCVSGVLQTELRDATHLRISILRVEQLYSHLCGDCVGFAV